MKKWLWLVLIPSLVFAERPDSLKMKNAPFYLDVAPQKIVIYPDREIVFASDIGNPNGPFEKFLDQAESNSHWRHTILNLRPGSVNLHRRLRELFQDRNLNVGFEPLETEFDILKDLPSMYSENYPAWSITYWDRRVLDMERESHAKGKPCEIDVYADYLVILTNNAMVTLDELQKEDNAFDQWLNQCENTIQCWYVFCAKTGSDKLYNLLQDKMFERGKQSGAYVKQYGTALEVPANGREPIYLLCQRNQLFEVKADGQSEPADIPNRLTTDPKTKYICFLVRPDSFGIFRKARKEAWMRGIDISCELQDESGPLAIGADGHLLFPERTSP